MRIQDEILVGEMLIQLNPKQEKLKAELQEYFEGIMTPALKSELKNPNHFEGGGPEFKKTKKKDISNIGLRFPYERCTKCC